MIAVPLNTVFGVVCVLAIVRRRFPGKGLVNAFVDLPLAPSPVVVGLLAYLLYGQDGWFGEHLEARGIDVLFALPAIVLATVFVSLPFVVGEVAPTLREIGDEQEQAACTLGASPSQTFWKITLPAIRWAADSTASYRRQRAGLGEYGAVAVVSGRVQGRDRDRDPARRGALPELRRGRRVRDLAVLAAMAVLVLIAMTLIKPREEAPDVDPDPERLQALASSSHSTTSPWRSSGSLTALLGPSGSGKSTLLRIVAGLGGRISGRSSSRARTRRRLHRRSEAWASSSSTTRPSST